MPAERQVIYLVRCSVAFDMGLAPCGLGSAAEAAKARLTELIGPVRVRGRTPRTGNQAMDGLFAGPAKSGEGLSVPHSPNHTAPNPPAPLYRRLNLNYTITDLAGPRLRDVYYELEVHNLP